MAKVKKNIIGLKCSECGNRNYTMYKTKNLKEKLEVNKYCGKCRKHTGHKETKVK